MHDGVILTELLKRLSERESALIEHAVRGLPTDQYQQTCGGISELRAIRDLIPQIIKDMRKE